MKKVILFAAFFLIAGLSSVIAQQQGQVNPIPSYNVPLTTLNTAFSEVKMHAAKSSREKRDMEVVISSSSTSGLPFFAKVWIVKDNGAVIKGPFFVQPDEELSVPIDNGTWGVIIRSEMSVTASVWTE